MKNILLVSNVVLIVMVGFLYYLHFNNKNRNTVKAKPAPQQEEVGRVAIAYIDLDSLQDNYGYYKKIEAEFEKKQVAANNEITSLQKRFQSRAMQLQEKGPIMTPQEQESAMKEINTMQQDLQAKKQGIDNELYNTNSKMKEDILARIQNFLQEYNKDGKFSYVFSYEPGFMFYKDSALNITSDVIAGLNKLYNGKEK